jgi:hypothetical protein
VHIKSMVLGLAVAAGLGSTAKAGNLVINGDLDRPGTTNSVYVNVYPSGDIPSWTVLGAPGNPGTFNAVYLYDNLGDATLPAFMPPSYYSCTPALGFVSGNSCLNPDGTGHFINLDSDPAFPAAISQSIAGLTKGGQYSVTFDWAAVERNDQTGPTSGYFLDVSLGGEHFLTSSIIAPPSLPSNGFSGWFTTSHTFTWDGTTSALTFLAHGLPTGLPPSINLDSISLTAVPEPATWEMMIAGIGGLMAVVARRRRRTVVAG